MKRTVTLLFLGLLSALGIGGVIHSVSATQSQRPVATIAQSSTLAQDTKEADEQHSDLKDDDDDEQENAHLQSLAKITPQQAREIAESAQGTTATEVELEVEDGSLVYEVEFADETEVYVDAGNGQILHTEVEDEEEDDSETPIQGSIQVPDSDDDDD